MKNCNEIAECGSRRDFLVKSAFLAGGLVLTLSSAGSLFGKPFEDVTVPIDSASPLNKIGGSKTVETSAGKVIIVRTGDATFAAVSAKCTHKGGPLAYNSDSKLFECEWHGSKFGADGANAGGPAKTPIATFPATGNATSVTVKTS